jgi:hypothetical protein
MELDQRGTSRTNIGPIAREVELLQLLWVLAIFSLMKG